MALGNYLNNPKQQCLGFRFGAMLKLADVKTRDSKVTLLHMLARIIQENDPDLLTFVNELEALKTAPAAMEATTGVVLFLTKGLAQMRQDLEALPADDLRMRDFLQQSIDKVEETVQGYDRVLNEFQDNVLYFGENAKDDIVGFFNNWKKFAHAYRVRDTIRSR